MKKYSFFLIWTVYIVCYAARYSTADKSVLTNNDLSDQANKLWEIQELVWAVGEMENHSLSNISLIALDSIQKNVSDLAKSLEHTISEVSSELTQHIEWIRAFVELHRMTQTDVLHIFEKAGNITGFFDKEVKDWVAIQKKYQKAKDDYEKAQKDYDEFRNR
jgi:hypothetical protein